LSLPHETDSDSSSDGDGPSLDDVSGDESTASEDS